MAERHPDLLDVDEVAALLEVPPTRFDRGWGPPPLPAYKRPRYWSRQIVETWLEEQRKGASWDSTKETTPRTGGAGSKSRAGKSKGQLAQQIAERLRKKSAASAPTTSPKRLRVVEGGRQD